MRPNSLLPIVCISTVAFGQAPKLPGVKCATPPTIDGVIDPTLEWKDAATYESFVDTNSGAPSSEHTKIWLAYDDKFIYFAAHADEPAQINATEYRVNASLSNEDHVSLAVDFSGTLADFNTFSINPLGATSLSLAGGRAAKREWLGEFVAKGKLVKGGYEVEARIPWALMRLGRSGKSDLRIFASRYHVHSLLTDAMSFTQNNQIQNSPYWVGVDLPKERTPQTLKLLPYGYGGWDKTDGRITDAGLDLKAPLTDKIELVGSVNPDFRNIENQLLSLDFSRFERLAGEVRPFFLEGRSYMGTALFASQRIKRFDVGLNTYGKIDDKTSFGLIDTWWAHNEENLVFNVTNNPTPNDQLRVSYAGTNRPEMKNDGYLIRYRKNVGQTNLFVRTMGTKDLDNGFGASHYGSIGWGKLPWYVYTDYSYTQPDFTPRLGFFPEVDLKGPSINVDYNPQWAKGPFAQADVNAYYVDYHHIDGSFYRREGALFATGRYRPLRVAPHVSVDWQNFEGEKDLLWTEGLSYPYNDSYRNLSLNYSHGTAATLPYRTLSFGGRYRTLRNRLDLSLTGQIVRYQGYSDQIIATASYDLGNDQSISGRLVKSNDKIGPYLAYRKAGNRGAEYFLLIGDPNRDQFRTAIVLKMTMPLEVLLRR